MSKLWLAGGATLLAALLIASIVVALTEREEPLPEGTPERVVQRFLQAIEAEDFVLAYGFVSDSLQQECAIEEFASRSMAFDRDLRDSRVTLEKTTRFDGSAVVVVDVTRFRSGGPFETSENSSEHRFQLRQDSGGQWRITDLRWPFYGKCGPREEAPILEERRPTSPDFTPANDHDIER